MKARLLIACLAQLLTVIGFAQNIIPNGSFEQTCGTNDLTIGGCPTFSNSCLPGWHIASGTPEIVFSGGADQNNCIQMQTRRGDYDCEVDGIYADLIHPLEKDHKYNFCFWYKTSYSNQVNFYVTLCTGVIPTGGSACLSGVPGVWSGLDLSIPNFTHTQWTHVSFSFDVVVPYDNIVIYPFCEGTGPFTHELHTLWVDGFSLSDAANCDGELNIDIPYPHISGYIEKGHFIRAGSNVVSTGNTYFVSTDPNADATFRAGYSELKDLFSSTPNSGHYFLIDPFYCKCPMQSLDGGRIGHTDSTTTIADTLAVLRVTPNPSHGKFSLELPRNRDGTIAVYDVYGRLILQSAYTSDQSIEIDLTAESNGIYFVRFVSGTATETTRVIKQ